MAKQLTVLLGMMALLLTTALPAAFAQGAAQYGGEEVSATGVIFDGLPQDVGGFGTHSITDEATGTLYALRSAGPDLASYGSQRVTVHGALTPGEEGLGEEGIEGNGTLPSIDVTRVEPAGGVEPGPRIVTATGVLGEPYTPGQDPTPVYDLADEATGTTYTLFDVGAGLEPYVGQRVTVEGTRSPGINPLSLDVTSVAAAGVGSQEITATFELAVECEPHAGTRFFAGASQQTTGLYDPDGNGTYTGSLTLPESFYDLGAFPVPVAILSGSPEVPNQQTVKYFGEMVLEDGDHFSAGVSFCDDGTGGGSGNGTANGNPVVSGDTSNAHKGGSGPVNASGGAGQDGGPRSLDAPSHGRHPPDRRSGWCAAPRRRPHRPQDLQLTRAEFQRGAARTSGPSRRCPASR